MDKLPTQSRSEGHRRKPATSKFCLLAAFCIASSLIYTSNSAFTLTKREHLFAKSSDAQNILRRCWQLNVTPGPPKDFNLRTVSDRYEPGTPTILLKNATIWTGRDSGTNVIQGDLLLDKGIIKAIGDVDLSDLRGSEAPEVIDLHGAWVTPGIVDMHSHVGVDSLPELKGSSDTNSHKGITQPWLRSLDGLNSHDEAYRLSISGGVATALVLPGSANAIGGQAFSIKLRRTKERSVSSMLLESPYHTDTMRKDPFAPPKWRQMKHACGENPSNWYSGTRMDTMWAFRQSYETARKIKQRQDEYCDRALSGDWTNLGTFPDDLQWEALVDVLRGRVKVHTHCYEATDLDGIVRLTNEFNFSIAAFHHAHDAYLVPELLKKAYGHPPAIAMFATNARYKREAYRGSEFAPRILAENGFQVVMKSDHPVTNSRHLLFEAQQAFYYGLPEHLALASVISTPATVLGLDHRIGFIKTGYDADVVVWDSHPLALGATPKQVYIDGIPQIEEPYVTEKPDAFQHLPNTPNFDKEKNDTLRFDGLPPLAPVHHESIIAFTNVNSVYIKSGSSVIQLVSAAAGAGPSTVLAHKGKLTVCVNDAMECEPSILADIKQIDLQGGSISPGLLTYGSPLGLEHIESEPSTTDGAVLSALESEVPEVIGGSGTVICALDGLEFSTRDAFLAYRAGVTSGVVAPTTGRVVLGVAASIPAGTISGLSTYFDTGAPHRLARSAVLQETVGFHVSIGTGKRSISTQIAALRHLLLGGGEGALGTQFERIVWGEIPLVVEVHSADTMASLIDLKEDVEEETGIDLRLVFSGASEAHLLAKEIGRAGVGVILNPSRPFPTEWRSRRILPGKPLTEKNALSLLMEHGVVVGFGVPEKWMARNLRFDLAWAAREVGGNISVEQALAVGSVNLEKLLGVRDFNYDLVATQGGSLFDTGSKVIAIISERKEGVDLL